MRAPIAEIDSPLVAAAFKAFPPAARRKLMALRRLILKTAAATKGVGKIEETLKWGEPAYLAKSGSTIRLGWKQEKPGEVAMYFICTTNLVDRFRELYPRELRYAGNRAVLLDVRQTIPQSPLRHCIEMALTYHRRR